ncbi:bifunctional GPN-loop GTPase/P-loop containing nucleoside triphosphate hydrolase/GPN-loop GTPase 2 [Babesia duncani]|uniref:GPN-loop GTPase 2 n=1 Tax=Babesia duncani TaxID=323732 RepID=A0AAD9UQE8_9APIC|nr:bifunctional GPN-loop GTPase/P-loop containing nucleoside triphosphate hydrolase/GPN-loop GTPase 2 [Babesia duncani]
MELVSDPNRQAEYCLGDCYFGYCIPTVLAGRSHFYRSDLDNFVTDWCQQYFDRPITELLEREADFGLASLGLHFKKLHFSKILAVATVENALDCWQILCGVWADLFKSACNYIEYRVSLIFTLFYLYHCHPLECNFPIVLSADTLGECLELAQVIIEQYRVVSVLDILNHFITRNHMAITLNDGVQYLHQNRVGGPMKLNWAGKSTYCAGIYNYLKTNGRYIVIVNLDPQVSPFELPYEAHIDICELIQGSKVSEQFHLGPNAKHLVANLDWLDQQLARFSDAYFLFDTPGQIELFTHHTALCEIIQHLERRDFRLTGVALMDCTLCANPFNYVSALLTCLSAQIQLQLPHVNVLSKIDMIKLVKKDLAFNLEYYAEAGSLQQLLIAIQHGQKQLPKQGQFTKFTAALCELIEDFNLVSFGTLDIQDPESIAQLVKKIDRCNGYISPIG